MTEAPEEKWLAHNGGLPTGNYPKSDMVRYIRADIHDAAVSAARKERMLEGLKVAKAIAEDSAENDWTDGVAAGWGIAEEIDVEMGKLV